MIVTCVAIRGRLDSLNVWRAVSMVTDASSKRGHHTGRGRRIVPGGEPGAFGSVPTVPPSLCLRASVVQIGAGIAGRKH